MYQKTKKTKTIILLPIFFLLGIACYLVINAWTLTFTDLKQNALIADFSQIHFNSSGNSFGWWVFWLGSKGYSSPVQISFVNGGETKYCFKQVDGIYYNDARWQRLWPLGPKGYTLLSQAYTWYANELSMTGGLYTACSWSANDSSIYGYIKYTLSGTPSTVSYLIAWAMLDFNTNKYSWVFKNNLQFFNHKTPLGYIWDSVGWIWFIGGQMSGNQQLLNYLNGTWSVNDAFALNNWVIWTTSSWSFEWSTWWDAANTMLSALFLQWSAILSKALNIYETKALLWNLDKRTVLLSSSDINASTVINTAKKNAETLCRGIGYLPNKTFVSAGDFPSSDTLCYSGSNLTINLQWQWQYGNYKNKTIVIKNGSLTLKGSMDADSPSLDVFIDWGNLYINTLGLGILTYFNDQGFPMPNNAIGINQWAFFKGNFVINGLLVWGTAASPTAIDKKVHLQGRFVSLNTPSAPSDWRVEQVGDTLGTDVYSGRINLENLFTWYCNLYSQGSDNTPCGTGSDITKTPFVILDGTFASRIIK